MDDPEYSIFLGIMFNTFTADEMAYAHIAQRRDIEVDAVKGLCAEILGDDPNPDENLD